MALSKEYVESILDYDPQTGIFRWKCKRFGVTVGAVAGVRQRYTRIKIDYKMYPAHHLAWLLMAGEMPSHQIDHVDLDKHNNAWSNLRATTPSLNAANQRAKRTNKCGLKGVCLQAGKWNAFIKVNGRSRNLGTFKNKFDAHNAYLM